MSIRVLGTFQSRDVADAVRDDFISHGYNADSLIVMANRSSAEPPEDADLEPGLEGQGGFAEFEEKIGKAVLQWRHRPNTMEGDGTEGAPTEGALIGITVADQEQATRVRQILVERYFAADVEIAQPD